MAKKTVNKKPKTARTSSSTRIYRPRLTRRDLEEILTFTKGLARASGALALSYYGRANPTLRYDHDLVTEADLAVQEYIYKEVHETYADHVFLGEEGSDRPIFKDTKEPIWVVDPVDGSASFSAGMPVWAVSIALFDAGKPVLGVIHMPVTGEVYSAIHTSRAMLNDREISSRDEVMDNESLILTYSRFHSEFTTHFPGKVRCLGSTAAHLAYVARGAAGGAVLGNVHIWDVAAGLVVLQAAGGTVRDLVGKKVDWSDYLSGEKIDRFLIAAPAGLHGEISGMLQPR